MSIRSRPPLESASPLLVEEAMEGGMITYVCTNVRVCEDTLKLLQQLGGEGRVPQGQHGGQGSQGRQGTL